MDHPRARIAVVGAGGSIATVGRHSLDLFEYGDFGRIIPIRELLVQVPEAASQADVVPVEFRTVPSQAIGPADWLALNRLIHQVAAEDPGLTGVVVTHGTSTL